MNGLLSEITAWLAQGRGATEQPWTGAPGSEFAGRKHSLSAVVQNGWLILRAEPQRPSVSGEEASESSRLPGLWKYAVPVGGSLEMRAELPFYAHTVTGDAFSVCLEETLDGFNSGTFVHLAADNTLLEIESEFSNIGIETRPSGPDSAVFDLESQTGHHQATADVVDGYIRLALQVVPLASATPASMKALNNIALRSSAVLRMARAVIAEPGPELRLECCFPAVSSGWILETAVQTLRAGADLLVLEAPALLDETTADAYLQYHEFLTDNGRNPLCSNV